MARAITGSSDAVTPENQGRRRRVALFTPLPPARTGTADYAADLISELEMLVDLTVINKVPRNFDPAKFDSVIYQIANNPFHAEIYQTALRHPGIIVLHDANLHELIRQLSSGLDPQRAEAYLREVFYEIYGTEWSHEKQGHHSIEAQPREFTMLRRLLDRSAACIVHSTHAENCVRIKGFRGKVARIPHGIRMRRADGSSVRSRFGIAPDAPLVGLFGYLRPDKLACESIAVFRQLLDTLPEARMIVAGMPHHDVPLAEDVAALKLQGKVHLLGFQDDSDALDNCIAACDVVLNLRLSGYGESSGIVARAFGLGRTVVVSDNGANRDLPDDACVKIPDDRYRDRVLLEALKWLLADRAVTEAIGVTAADWAASACNWTLTARHYAEFVAGDETANVFPEPARSSPEGLRQYLHRWVKPGTPREGYLRDHEARLIRTLELTPRGNSGDAILEMGCYFQITPALRHILNYGQVRGCYLGRGETTLRSVTSREGEVFECPIDLFNCERDDFPYATDTFATVLCCELLEHLEFDPMRTLRGIHRVLKPGGILILTTPNIVSLRAVRAVMLGDHPAWYARYPDPSDPEPSPGHRREYTPAEISQLLAAAGFVAEHIETGDYGAVPPVTAAETLKLLGTQGLSTSLRGDCIYAIGRKESLPNNPLPSWLYDSVHSG